MNKTKVTAHTYVCELPDDIQNQIFQECKETLLIWHREQEEMRS